MDQNKQQLLLSLFLGLIMPGLIFSGIRVSGDGKTPAQTEGTQQTAATDIQTQEEIFIPILNDSGAVEQMALTDYLTGVVLAEMPASFAMEAKKAQAVAARTVTLRLMERGGKHAEAVVCMDHTCCQAFISQTEYLSSGGSSENYSLALQAVRETTGKVICYGTELIDATYFSCSGGRTEDAVAVWGSEVAYLQAVDSPGEEAATYYTDTLELTPEQLEAKLGVTLSGQSAGWFTGTVYTDGGGVASVRIGGKLFSGTQLRSLLGLKSTAFTVSAGSGIIRFTTKGFGHRVGMSQYGAQAMAESGSTYQQILAHYYANTVVKDYQTADE